MWGIFSAQARLTITLWIHTVFRSAQQNNLLCIRVTDPGFCNSSYPFKRSFTEVMNDFKIIE